MSLAEELTVSGVRPPAEVTRIQNSRGALSVQLREVWRFRELIGFLVWRDIKVRYKQTMLGAAWAVIQPFMSMVVFSIFFGRLGKIPSDGVPYPVFSYAALVPWVFFANGLSNSATSLVQSSNLLRKVYFPRLVIPVATVLSGIPDFAVSFVVLLGIMAWFGLAPGAAVLGLPLLLLLALTTALGCGLWLAAVNVRYRDVRYVVPFLIQIWLFATPVAYPSSLLSPGWRCVYGLNPMVGVVEGFRWALLGSVAPDLPMLAVSSVMSAVILISGMNYFRRTERTFADTV